MRNLELQPRRSVAEKHRLNALVYDALRREDEEKVIKLCEDFEEQGLHILTVHDDTVLQAVTYAMKPSLVLRLLQELPDRLPLSSICTIPWGYKLSISLTICTQSEIVAKNKGVFVSPSEAFTVPSSWPRKLIGLPPATFFSVLE